MKSEYKNIEGYITKDNSLIKELLHPETNIDSDISLAEATVNPECSTRVHKHIKTTEIYHVTKGSGIMHLGGQKFSITEKDSILIKPNTPHFVENTGNEPLKILCFCTPAYSHEDTVVISCAGY